MPIKTSPSKVKIVSYLTHIERAEAEVKAKERQLSLSEWVRIVLCNELSKEPDSIIAHQAPTSRFENLPQGKDFLRDFQFGDLGDPSLVEDKED